uniref:GRF-type domain-containing protein n=1 Tax=Chenopodium quinoa TaxID=63459 RepID=A0A803N641_CHEQI
MSGGRRKISSGSLGSSSTSRHLNQGRIKCTCGLDDVIGTIKQGHNIGSKFYRCPKWPDTQCNFLMLMELNNDVDELRFKLLKRTQ